MPLFIRINKNTFGFPKAAFLIKMDSSASKLYFLLFLMSILNVTTPGSFLSTANQFLHKRLNKPLVQTTQHDTIITIQPPISTLPTTPLTNPVTTPSTGISTPPIVTVPSANPTAPVTFPPATQNPIIPQIPVTNPVTTPSTTIPGVQQPVTNPATTYPSPTAGNDPTTTPVVVPPGSAATNGPTVPGQLIWCIAKLGAPQMTTQAALDFACGMTDCSAIQQGGNCYNPNSLLNHASYAFNSYYQRNPMPTSCDFGGAAVITNVNPSSGPCIYTAGSSSSASPTPPSPVTTTPTGPTPTPTTASPVTTTPTPPTPTTASPVTTTPPTPTTVSPIITNPTQTPTTPSGSVTPPIIFNASSPFLGGSITGYGEAPPAANISSASSSRPSNLQPLLGCIIVVTTIITWRTVLDV